MKWLTPLTAEEIISDTEQNAMGIRFSNFENTHNLKKNFSVLTQFYLKLGSYDKTSQTSIYIKNVGLRNEIIQEILLHFESCRIVLEGEVPVEVIISDPKMDSLSELNEISINPVIQSLFFNEIYKEADFIPSNPYFVRKEYIDEYKDSEFDYVYNFLKKTTINGQVFINLPNTIKLNDSSTNQIFIRYLTFKDEQLYLWVDGYNNVSMVQF
ncbi:hypothetical protein LG307_10635 [Sutcliffiella horikoshii]|uniref:hypothetical protein n=1 Tax=Sutcliffiella horikoshii TaxID=79883 RepID=UPI00384C4F98